MRKKLRAIHDQLNQVRTDLYQESQQQLEIKKKLRSIRDQLNQAEEVPQGLLEPWELYEVLGIVRRQIRQRGESRMSFITC